MLADGSEAILPIYRGWVLWHGRELRIPVGESASEALIGISLLAENRLQVEATTGGEVLIEEMRHG